MKNKILAAIMGIAVSFQSWATNETFGKFQLEINNEVKESIIASIESVKISTKKELKEKINHDIKELMDELAKKENLEAKKGFKFEYAGEKEIKKNNGMMTAS